MRHKWHNVVLCCVTFWNFVGFLYNFVGFYFNLSTFQWNLSTFNYFHVILCISREHKITYIVAIPFVKKTHPTRAILKKKKRSKAAKKTFEKEITKEIESVAKKSKNKKRKRDFTFEMKMIAQSQSVGWPYPYITISLLHALE